MSRPKFGIKLFLLLAAAAFALLLFVATPRMSRKVFETFEIQNGHFRIRVKAHAELAGGFAPGAYYVFESAPVAADNWRKIMVYRRDDPMPIPREQIRFVSDRVAYVFIGPKFAVTIDGGNSWSVWDGSSHLRSGEGYQLFKYPKVEIDAAGHGVMTIEPLEERYGTTRHLYTKDYGQHWVSESDSASP